MTEQILAALKVAPMSTRALAKRIKRRREDVQAACVALRDRGLLRRESERWIPEPAPRCAGVNAEGTRCGREAQPDSDRCILHQETSDEPTWLIPMPSWSPWNRDLARRSIRGYGSKSKQAAAQAAGILVPILPYRVCDQNSLCLAHDARLWAERHDSEWLAQFDEDHR